MLTKRRHPKGQRGLALRAISVGALLFGSACAPPPPQSPVQQASAAAVTAAAQFATLAQGSATSGVAPRATNPTVGPLLDTVWNTTSLPSAPNAADERALFAWLTAINQVGKTYLYAGTAQAGGDLTTPAAEAQVERNMFTYAPELGRFYDAMLLGTGADAAATRASPQMQPQWAQMQPYLVIIAQGNIADIVAVNEANDWREARARTLIVYAQRFGALMTTAQQQTLEQSAQSAAQSATDPQAAALLNQFAATLQAGAHA